MDLTSDLIKPEYYRNGGFDVIDYLHIQFGAQAAKEFCRGNIIKYVTRYEQKNGVKDLQKAQTYIARLVELEGAKEKKRYISNHVKTVDGIKDINGTKLYQCQYKCDCGDVGRRFVKEDATITSCHKCEKELTLYPAAINEAHDEEFNYFTAY